MLTKEKRYIHQRDYEMHFCQRRVHRMDLAVRFAACTHRPSTGRRKMVKSGLAENGTAGITRTKKKYIHKYASIWSI